MDKPQKPYRPKTEWKHDKTFSDHKSGLAVVVSKSHGLNPMYSFQVGRVREDGSVATNMQWRTKRDQVNFELESDHAAMLASLMTSAQEHVVIEMQWAWEHRLQHQIDRDTQRSGEGGKQQKFVRAPGKTARDKAKKGGHKG